MKITRNRKAIIATLLVAIMVFGGVTAFADDFAPTYPSIVEVRYGEVFVFNPHGDENYPQMGLYRNTEPLELIFPIDLGPRVFAEDFIFADLTGTFVFIPTISQDIALQFFDRYGVLIRTYYISDLVMDMDTVAFTASMALWEQTRSRFVSNIGQLLTIITSDNIVYSFSTWNGEIVNSKQFDYDTPSGWAGYETVSAIDLDIVPQNLQLNFTQAITRAEFSALAVNMLEAVTGAEITGRMEFNDTTDINVQKMGYLGVVEGVGGGNFNPDATLTRQEAAVMLFRILSLMAEEFPHSQIAGSLEIVVGGRAIMPSFYELRDKDQISYWAVEAVRNLYFMGTMRGTGDNIYSPLGIYTREQSIVTMLRLYRERDAVG